MFVRGFRALRGSCQAFSHLSGCDRISSGLWIAKSKYFFTPIATIRPALARSAHVNLPWGSRCSTVRSETPKRTANRGTRIREAIIQRLEREADAGADWNGRSEHGGIG